MSDDALERAFETWCASAAPVETTYTAFKAGWKARKEAQYSGVDNEPYPAHYGEWVAPRRNPAHKLFDPEHEGGEDGC